MERDPLRFVWRTTPALHCLAFALLLLALPLGFAAADLVRVVIDDVMNGLAFRQSVTAPFLRLAVSLPERIAEAPLVILPGVPLDRAGFARATVMALAALGLAAGLIALLVAALRGAVRRRAVARLRETALEAILAARPSAKEEARQAAALSGEGLARHAGLLGDALLVPAFAGAAVAVAAFYALAVDWRLALVVLAGLGLVAVLRPRREQLDRQIAEALVTEGAALRRIQNDLVRRLPALRAHGTAPFERERLAADFAERRRPLGGLETRAALARAGEMSLTVLVLVVLVAAVAWPGATNGITPGAAVAVAAATGVALLAIGRLAHWQRAVSAAERHFAEMARILGALQARARPVAEGSELPASGALVADQLAAYDPATGARVASLSFSAGLPSHLALVGDAASGAPVLAGLIGGQLEPTGGRLTFAGVDLTLVPAEARAARIAYAGADTVLLNGTMRQNLLYGCPDTEAPDIEARLSEAATVAGLDRLIQARGLSGQIDPVRDPKLASAVVDARRAVREALRAMRLEELVDPFDPGAYNRHATIGENILFGVPLGDTFREANLPTHPFVRAILEAEQLTKPLQAMGLAVAKSLVEIFADLPEGHPLFQRFSFFSATERGYFADLVERESERRRGSETGRDRERLIGLALRYSESRHRLGLLEPELEARLVRARHAFAELIPVSLKPTIEFYDAERLCAAASLRDNLLFGRVAHDRAGAEEEVLRLIRRVLTERGLDREVFKVGLDSRIDPRGVDLLSTETAAIDLARCLVRRPAVLVAARALDGLTTADADALVQRLRRAMVGRGLVLAVPGLTAGMEQPPFDATLRFDRGALVTEDMERLVGTAA
jgi:ABC-type multidrug transport system fused ATPase/permease subunit